MPDDKKEIEKEEIKPNFLELNDKISKLEKENAEIKGQLGSIVGLIAKSSQEVGNIFSDSWKTFFESKE